MQAENIIFTFKLGLINIHTPIPVQILLNDTVLHELKLGPTSNSINFVAGLENNQNYSLSFRVLEINRPSRINLSNVNISWQDNNRFLNTGWRAQSPNEVWNYTDPTATDEYNRIVNRAKNVNLDYFIGNKPGYLKKFGRFESKAGSVFTFNKLEKPFTIVEPGAFKIDFTSPINYWLYRHLV